MKLTDFIVDVGRPVAYYPGLKKVTKSTTATILLCQFVYWLGKGEMKDGTIYKTSAQLEEETGLTYEEQKTARLRLVYLGVLEEHYARLDHNIHFKVNVDAINSLWEASSQCLDGEHGNATMATEPMPRSLNGTTETTTENTTHTLPVSSPTPPRVARTADDVRAMTLEALRSHAASVAGGKSETQHFPPDVLQTVTRVCELWNLTPPRSKEARFSHWVKSAGELKHACGEYGISILDDVYAAWLESQYAVASPGSLINSVVAMVGKRRGEEPGGLAGTEDMTYYWNSELTPEENMRLMKEAQTKLPKQETTDGRPDSPTQT